MADADVSTVQTSMADAEDPPGAPASMADADEAPDAAPPPLAAGQSTDAMDAEDSPSSPEASAPAAASPAAPTSGPPIAAVAAPPPAAPPAPRPATAAFTELAKYTPMRLTLPERRLFRLLEAALTVSEYTDRVDILTWKRRDGRIVQQVKDICSILSGLVVAQVCCNQSLPRIAALHCSVHR